MDKAETTNYVKSVLPVKLDGVKKNPGSVLVYIDKEARQGRPRAAYVQKLEKAMVDGKAKGIPESYFEKYWRPFLENPLVD